MLLRFLVLTVGTAAAFQEVVVPVLVTIAVAATLVLLVLSLLPGTRPRATRTALPVALVALPVAPAAVLPVDATSPLK